MLYLLKKKLVRIISCAPFKAHTEPLMFAMRLSSVNDINQYMTAILMYQCLNCITPQVFNDFFQKNNTLHDHDTRQSNDLHVPYARLNVWKFCFKIHGASTWNNIPILIKQSQSLDVFKKSTAASSYWIKDNCTPCYELNCTDDWNVWLKLYIHLTVLRRHTATFSFSCLILFVFVPVLINMCLQWSRVISL